MALISTRAKRFSIFFRTKSSVQISQSKMAKVATENTPIVETRPSELEGRASALFIAKDLSKKYDQHRRRPQTPCEIFHIHDTDGSAHLFLSAADAEILLNQGWGERHPIGGRALGMPGNYVMLYAPRNEEDLKIQQMFIRAAALYAFDGKEGLQGSAA